MAPLKFPATPGGDFSGVVTEIGEGVSGFKKGDEVYGQANVTRSGSGSFAEFASADVNTTAHKPKNANHVEAAALPLTGVSAWQALVDHLGLSRGEKILIHGGAGGIGTIAIQLAKYLGAYVVATVSAKDIPYVKELGTDEAIDYKNQSFEELSKLAELVDKRAIKVHIEKTFPLEQAGEALMYLQNGHPRGKVVLKIRED